MKRQKLKESLLKKTNSEELSAFAADCIESTIDRNNKFVFAVKKSEEDKSKVQLVCCREYDKWYQTKDDTKNCRLSSWFNGKNDVDIIIRRGQRTAKEGFGELQIIHGKVVPADISIYGTELYIIHMTPGKDGEPTTIETKHYKDVSSLYDFYLRLIKENEKSPYLIEPKTTKEIVKTAKYWFEACLTNSMESCYRELNGHHMIPDDVRTNTVKPGEEAMAINKIFKDPFAVIRRFEQIEESKKENRNLLSRRLDRKHNLFN